MVQMLQTIRHVLLVTTTSRIERLSSHYFNYSCHIGIYSTEWLVSEQLIAECNHQLQASARVWQRQQHMQQYCLCYSKHLSELVQVKQHKVSLQTMLESRDRWHGTVMVPAANLQRDRSHFVLVSLWRIQTIQAGCACVIELNCNRGPFSPLHSLL